MSDFDTVLERLLNEPSFAAVLAADPAAALSGYRLAADEVELLRSQASPDSGGGLATVETRTNKSSTMGLFSAFADLGHTLSGGSSGGAGGGSVSQPWQPVEHSGLGDAPKSGLGDAPGGSSGLGDAPAPRGLAEAIKGAEELAPPKGYHPHIDADGDGHWDKATFIGTKGHGVEILVDVNHDGHADFVGHDTNGDGLVDYADYDKDDNGVFEKRMYDDNGDGWLDRTVWHQDR
ncbi:hypothetical protein [Actinoplanes subtropicus]|uniref:hypothetical protein n=1 Tax=Actinoplanes subtropicus TaxID=543632 RepID=UPI00054FA71D|nr:hypothetical protein [Actinoplanes subtropicus]